MRSVAVSGAVSLILTVAIFGGLLFAPAGTLHWWRAWVLLGAVFLATLATIVTLYPGNEALLEERFKPPLQESQPWQDKLLVSLFLLEFFGLLVFIPLDVFRFHLLSRPGPLTSGVGLLIFLAGWTVIVLAMKANRYAAPVVKRQREQQVVDTGVYGLVRHPMYLGALLILAGMSLWLESWAGTVVAVLPAVTLALRAREEERFLCRELPGYDAYRRRVRYRLVPYLW